MDAFNIWLNNIRACYKSSEINYQALRNSVHHPPEILFTLPLSEDHDEPIAYWLEGCQSLCHYDLSHDNTEQAFGYLQYAYSKLQQLLISTPTNNHNYRWCYKKLTLLLVAQLEFCQQQTSPHWQMESHAIIEFHILFLNGRKESGES